MLIVTALMSSALAMRLPWTFWTLMLKTQTQKTQNLKQQKIKMTVLRMIWMMRSHLLPPHLEMGP